MHTLGRAELEFDRARQQVKKGKQLRDGLSAVVARGSTLWLANDESCSLERLSRVSADDAELHYAAHVQYPLRDYLDLPCERSEIDIEGLDIDGDWLWLVGSHSLKREKPDADAPAQEQRQALATLASDGNRYLLARLPLAHGAGGSHPQRRLERDGSLLCAAQLEGDAVGNELSEALADDPHLGPFLKLPGKDNGFDIEGLAVHAGRVFVGLRGPVLRGWAVILELEPVPRDNSDHVLRLKRIGPGQRRYRKHFLQLDGLGIRDLVLQGDDLLILAGPTMDLDGPVELVRWPGGARPEQESVLHREQLIRLGQLPFGQGSEQGRDHAEGMTLCPQAGKPCLLVVYDASADSRVTGTSSVAADLFVLP